MPKNARLVDRYRAEVEAFMEVPYDVELLRAHMKRNRIDEPRQASLDLLVYELRKRIKRFRDVEPKRYDQIEQRLRESYREREAFNVASGKRTEGGSGNAPR